MIDNLIVRWLIRRDMAEVLKIESASFECPWCDDDFLSVLSQRNCIGMVAEHGCELVGFMIYELAKSRLLIRDFAVHPKWRRHGVGTAMVERLKDKLNQQRRTELRVELRERNLDGQRFYRAQGFKAIEVLREHYADTDEDCYVMQYKMPVSATLTKE